MTGIAFIKTWFYRTTLYYKFRYYFIRKKAPLSWIFWGEIMRRESSWQGSYHVAIATVGQPDCTISFDRGAPRENNIEIDIYDGAGNHIERVKIPLGYRAMGRVVKGFNEASAISRRIIKEENHNNDLELPII